MSSKLKKWDEERVEALLNMAGDEDPVTVETVEAAAEALETTRNSVAAKLRKEGRNVESMAKTRQKAFSDEEADALSDFVAENTGKYTYSEIASLFAGGKFSAKSIQGKLLSMELHESVRPTPKPETTKTYTEEEEATFIKMAAAGSFLEDIAEALGKSLNSVRGKALSLNKMNGTEMPKQKQSYAKTQADPLEAVGDLSELTVAEIAEKIEKSERGVKTMLTNRGLTCSNWDGAKRREKLDAKSAD